MKDSPHLDYDEAIEPEIYRDFAQTTVTPFLTGLVIRSHADPARLSGALRSRLLRKYPDSSTTRRRKHLAAALFRLAIFGIRFNCPCIGGHRHIWGRVVCDRFAQQRVCDPFGFGRDGGPPVTDSHDAEPDTGADRYRRRCSWGMLDRQVYRVSVVQDEPFDTGACLFSVAVLPAIALLATAGPALRVGRIDPATVLRGE